MELLNPTPLVSPSFRPPFPVNGQFNNPLNTFQPPFQSRSIRFANQIDQKRQQFAKGIYISGLESCMTTAMIMRHFNIKPINAIKHPMTIKKESKGFAFIYYGSQDDAQYVRKTLDKSIILKNQIRVLRTGIPQHFSKMMIKLKTAGLEEKVIKQNEQNYFNETVLEREIQRITSGIFGSLIQLNKITISRSPKTKQKLRYARAFFQIKNLSQVKNIASRSDNSLAANEGESANIKNQYEIALGFLSDLLNRDQFFSKFATTDVYSYSKQIRSQVLFIKGIKVNPKQDKICLAQEIQKFFEQLNPQWIITNSYADLYDEQNAWAHITLIDHKQAKEVYDFLIKNRPKFRDVSIYSNLKNMKDCRTVILSIVRQDAQIKTVDTFLTNLAANSKMLPADAGIQSIRQYAYYDFRVAEQKTIYKTYQTQDSTKSVLKSSTEEIPSHWTVQQVIPKRLVINFLSNLSKDSIVQLGKNICLVPGYTDIFLTNAKDRLIPNHLAGHINKHGVYIKHWISESQKKKNTNQNRPYNGRVHKPKFNNQPVNLNHFSFSKGGVPNINPNKNMNFRGIPQIRINGGLNSIGGFNNTEGQPGFVPSAIPRPFNSLQNGQKMMGSQPPIFGQQPMIPGGFKQGIPGMTGLSGLSGLSGLPGMSNIPGLNGNFPAGISPIGGMTNTSVPFGASNFSNIPGMSKIPGLGPARPPNFTASINQSNPNSQSSNNQQ